MIKREKKRLATKIDTFKNLWITDTFLTIWKAAKLRTQLTIIELQLSDKQLWFINLWRGLINLIISSNIQKIIGCNEYYPGLIPGPSPFSKRKGQRQKSQLKRGWTRLNWKFVSVVRGVKFLMTVCNSEVYMLSHIAGIFPRK